MTAHIVSNFAAIHDLRARAAGRKQLGGLTDSQLNDIGITRELAFIEASKPFWVK